MCVAQLTFMRRCVFAFKRSSTQSAKGVKTDALVFTFALLSSNKKLIGLRKRKSPFFSFQSNTQFNQVNGDVWVAFVGHGLRNAENTHTHIHIMLFKPDWDVL